MDEFWVDMWGPEAKQRSVEWRHSGTPAPEKFCHKKFAGKVLVSVFWD